MSESNYGKKLIKARLTLIVIKKISISILKSS